MSAKNRERGEKARDAKKLPISTPNRFPIEKHAWWSGSKRCPVACSVSTVITIAQGLITPKLNPTGNAISAKVNAVSVDTHKKIIMLKAMTPNGVKNAALVLEWEAYLLLASKRSSQCQTTIEYIRIFFWQPDFFDFPRNEDKPISNNQHADDYGKSRHENGWNECFNREIWYHIWPI